MYILRPMPAPKEIDPREIPTDALVELAVHLAHEDPDPEAQQLWACIHALQPRADQELFEIAAKWCVSEACVERELGADLLGQFGNEEDDNPRPFAAESLKLLIGLLEDPEPEVQQSAIVAMGHLRNRNGDLPVDTLWDSSLLQTAAQHEQAEVREAVAHALGGPGHCDDSPVAVEIMLGLLDDANDLVRNWATFGLGVMSQIDSPAIRGGLAARLSDPHDDTRNEATVALAMRHDEGVIALVEHDLQGDEVFDHAIEAAGAFPRPEFLPHLQRLLELHPGDDVIQDALNNYAPE